MNATQTSRLPTRKLTVGALIGPAVSEAWGAVMADAYPPMSGPEVSMLIGAIAAVAVAYWIKDAPNVAAK